MTILLCDKPDQHPSGNFRERWLRELFPTARVVRTPDDLPEAPEPWARRTLELLDQAPTHVFSSELYGDPYAALMGAHHRLVDLDRSAVPVSGTVIREDALAHWSHLLEPVREFYAFRVVVVGAESTGKTTLCKELADRFRAPWVPEYGREYTELLYNGSLTEAGVGEGHLWDTGDFLTIAAEQNRRENLAARSSNGIIFCDTNAWATGLWHERYLGFRSPELDALGQESLVHLYLHTAPDLPFVQDGLRDGESIREWMESRFTQALPSLVPHARITGLGPERTERAIRCVTSAWHQRTRTPLPR